MLKISGGFAGRVGLREELLKRGLGIQNYLVHADRRQPRVRLRQKLSPITANTRFLHDHRTARIQIFSGGQAGRNCV